MANYTDKEKSKILILWGFNNYFDRKIIYHANRETSPTGDFTAPYKEEANGYEIHTDINFNTNDGINTDLVVNFDEDGNITTKDKPNYLVVYQRERVPAPGGQWFYNELIRERYFIEDAIRLRGFQYRLILRRDVIADAYNDIKKMPAYMLKGHLNENDPRILNDEGLNLNKIKVDEYEIKEYFKQGVTPRNGYACTNWIIGYFDSTVGGEKITAPGTVSPTNYVTFAEIASEMGGSITVSDLTAAINGTINFISKYAPLIEFNFRTRLNLNYKRGQIFSSGLNFDETRAAWQNGKIDGVNPLGDVANLDEAIANLQTYLNGLTKYDILDGFNASLSNNLKVYLNEQQIILEKYNGRIVQYGGVFYKLNIQTVSSNNIVAKDIVARNSSTFLTNITNALDLVLTDPDGTGQYALECCYEQLTISLENYNENAITVTIPTTHNTLEDAPYSMFAIPLNIIKLAGMPVAPKTKLNRNELLKLATNIAKKLGTKLYDLQLLPYFPGTPNLALNEIDEAQATKIEIVDGVEPGVNELGSVMFFPKTSTFKKILYGEELIDPTEIARTPILRINESKKIESQTDLYRIISPNYAGAFEFNLSKNGGEVSYWVVDGTYKPYNPYLKISPQFAGLYGTNYNDQRGLICGGDFSLPIMSDQWINYQINNKNYATIFSRDIQNLDFRQGQEARLEGLKAVTGTLTGTVSGAVGGFMSTGGSPYGAIAGAAVGLAGSAIGGAMDVSMGRERRAEEKDYILDRFNLNLMNIKALPESIARNSSINANTRDFPFIEHYTCTEEEKEALKNKIKYDGMTINSIGIIGDFIDQENETFIRCQLIRGVNSETEINLNEDTHYLNAVYEELLKGVYIK